MVQDFSHFSLIVFEVTSRINYDCNLFVSASMANGWDMAGKMSYSTPISESTSPDLLDDLEDDILDSTSLPQSYW